MPFPCRNDSTDDSNDDEEGEEEGDGGNALGRPVWRAPDLENPQIKEAAYKELTDAGK